MTRLRRIVLSPRPLPTPSPDRQRKERPARPTAEDEMDERIEAWLARAWETSPAA